MADLKTVMAYICANYESPNDLSNARLTKLVYLCDWEHARQTGNQMTGIQWHFNHHGPWVPDVSNLAYRDAAFEVRNVTNAFGSPKELISLREPVRAELAVEERQVVDNVMAKTTRMYFCQFIDYVYSTYPVKHRPKYSMLDLEQLAEEERRPATESDTARVARALDAYVNGARGMDVPSVILKAVQLPAGFDEPTVEDIVMPDDIPTPEQGTVTVDVEMLIDGFMEKAQAYFATEGEDVYFHQEDWSDNYSWVFCERPATLVFDVSDVEEGGRAELMSAIPTRRGVA